MESPPPSFRAKRQRITVDTSGSLHCIKHENQEDESEFQRHTRLRRLRYLDHLEEFLESQAYFKAVDFPPEPNTNAYLQR
ncbi:hypothetical protein B5M09_011567 [Aphanomyces astaci]|uniref:Uncharacterized protein n=1 Tax=Aphanomyces astaci TaxID=112090 RepID=A0A3R7W9Y7_APHAT|nr:hypothetical protein B5M09_011567 [Aphanomyces astaci]